MASMPSPVSEEAGISMAFSSVPRLAGLLCGPQFLFLWLFPGVQRPWLLLMCKNEAREWVFLSLVHEVCLPHQELTGVGGPAGLGRGCGVSVGAALRLSS